MHTSVRRVTHTLERHTRRHEVHSHDKTVTPSASHTTLWSFSYCARMRLRSTRRHRHHARTSQTPPQTHTSTKSTCRAVRHSRQVDRHHAHTPHHTTETSLITSAASAQCALAHQASTLSPAERICSARNRGNADATHRMIPHHRSRVAITANGHTHQLFCHAARSARLDGLLA